MGLTTCCRWVAGVDVGKPSPSRTVAAISSRRRSRASSSASSIVAPSVAPQPKSGNTTMKRPPSSRSISAGVVVARGHLYGSRASVGTAATWSCVFCTQTSHSVTVETSDLRPGFGRRTSIPSGDARARARWRKVLFLQRHGARCRPSLGKPLCSSKAIWRRHIAAICSRTTIWLRFSVVVSSPYNMRHEFRPHNRISPSRPRRHLCHAGWGLSCVPAEAVAA